MLINKNYKVNHYNVLTGKSLDRLLTTEILLKDKDLFNNYIVVSSSFTMISICNVKK